ncbi:porin [Haliangium sp.]|uniref:porin n=1 Tax=Haliangium sp. TaxID=2663208 RepID=UPI003D113505
MKSSMKGLMGGLAAMALLVAVPVTSALAEEEGATKTGYKSGFFIETGDGSFKLATQARVQTRYTFNTVDAGGVRTTDSAFNVQRARLTLKGHAFSEDIGYKFQTDFPTGNSISLKDFYVDYAVGDVLIRAGQYKRPFSRQQITSSGRQEFVDRAVTDKGFDAGRDVGLMVHNNYEKSPEIEWAVGLFNGTKDKVVPDTFNPALVARVGYNHGGIKGYSEADLEGGPLRFAVGASVIAEMDWDGGQEDGDGDPATGADNGAVRAELDCAVKSNGFAATAALYFSTRQDGADFTDQAADAIGAHLQVGYMLGDVHHVAGRYAVVAPDEDINTSEIGVVYSMFRFAHGFKWQTDLTLLKQDGLSFGDEVRVRSQLQLSF